MSESVTHDWDKLKHLLPEGWQAQAIECGAFRRRRNVPSPEALLRLVLDYARSGSSLATTAALAETAGITRRLSTPALLKRVRQSHKWLAWITRNCLAETQWPISPERIRRIRVCDATHVRRANKRLRIHYSISLPDGLCDWAKIMEWSEKGSAETFAHWSVCRGDIMMGDCAYGSRNSVASVLDQGGDVVVRIYPDSFPLLDECGNSFDSLEWVSKIEHHKPISRLAYFQCGQRRLGPVRLIAVRLDKKKAEQARKRVRQTSIKNQRKPSPRSTAAAGWLFVVTSLDEKQFANEWVIKLFSLRWQVELSFKRLKSLLQTGDLPALTTSTALAWLQAKLLLAILGETVAQLLRGSCDSPKRRSLWREQKLALMATIHAVAIAVSLPTMMENCFILLDRCSAERRSDRPMQLANFDFHPIADPAGARGSVPTRTADVPRQMIRGCAPPPA